MIFKKSNGNTAKTLEGEVEKLELRRIALQGKLAGAEAALEQARAEQREFLISGADDGAKSRAKIDAQLTECERDADALHAELGRLAGKQRALWREPLPLWKSSPPSPCLGRKALGAPQSAKIHRPKIKNSHSGNHKNRAERRLHVTHQVKYRTQYLHSYVCLVAVVIDFHRYWTLGAPSDDLS
jgi:hypothetical protein